jgi:hypothetical protein
MRFATQFAAIGTIALMVIIQSCNACMDNNKKESLEARNQTIYTYYKSVCVESGCEVCGRFWIHTDGSLQYTKSECESEYIQKKTQNEIDKRYGQLKE